ncbi:MAG TPA: PA14 domain-containing protein, partial [Chitinophagaceae bacterium]|nr:PA14 domain-containing protein [Chitinophagaceae bacterium]
YPAPNPPLTCATNTSPANGSTIATNTTATLSWSAVANAVYYNVYLWTGNTAPVTPIANIVGNPSYIATGLTASTLYNWYVVPVNAYELASGCVNTKTTFTTASTAIGDGTGLQGVYYNGTTLSGAPLLTRIDTSINFVFDYNQQPVVLSPAPGIVPEDLYSVSWTGFVQPLYTETYTFYTNSDDGIRLWVNNVLLIDSWIDQDGSIQRSGTIALVAGQKYDIRIEFYEKAGSSVTKLYWSSASTPKAIVPKSQLFPPVANARMMDHTESLKSPATDALAFAFTTASISPNPVKRGQPARLQINSSRTGTVVVAVMSSNGNRTSNQTINLVKGINITTVHTNALAQGLYLISITGGNKPLTMKLIIQ